MDLSKGQLKLAVVFCIYVSGFQKKIDRRYKNIKFQLCMKRCFGEFLLWVPHVETAFACFPNRKLISCLANMDVITMPNGHEMSWPELEDKWVGVNLRVIRLWSYCPRFKFTGLPCNSLLLVNLIYKYQKHFSNIFLNNILKNPKLLN